MKAILVAEQGTADHVGLGLNGLRLAGQLSPGWGRHRLNGRHRFRLIAARIALSLALDGRLTEVSMGASDGWSGAAVACAFPHIHGGPLAINGPSFRSAFDLGPPAPRPRV